MGCLKPRYRFGNNVLLKVLSFEVWNILLLWRTCSTSVVIGFSFDRRDNIEYQISVFSVSVFHACWLRYVADPKTELLYFYNRCEIFNMEKKS